jgi:hypothetical protein
MKRFLAVALVGLLMLVSFTGDALADRGKGKNKAGHSAEQGAQHGNKDDKKPPKHVAVAVTDNDNENDNADVGIDDNENDNDSVDSVAPEKVGICHATGNGSFVFIEVSRNAVGHVEHHAEDIVGVAAPEHCPATVAEGE